MMIEKRKEEGRVYLIGAGPGDPKLLTLRGKECIEVADVVVYDYLANDQLLLHARPDAEVIYAGKRKGNMILTQSQINNLLVEKAREVKVVARLKGGDPFVFGRGGEEALALAEAGIPFEVVPGVTSAVAVAAYAGIPLTHRDYATTVVFTSGHEDPAKAQSTIPWEALARDMGTLVFYMGITNLPGIVSNLTKYGRDPKTPIALVRWGTKLEQETVVGTLEDIVGKAQSRHLAPPVTIVVGQVVHLREQLNWFESRPLFGKRVLITRTQEQAGTLSECFARYGAEPVVCPTIQTLPPQDYSGLDRAIAQASTYDWIIFTSANGVRYYFDRLVVLHRDVRALAGVKIAAIGVKTAEALKNNQLLVDLIPDESVAEGLLEKLSQSDIHGTRFLIPRAREAREILPLELERRGGVVDVVEAYRTVRPERGVDRIIDLLRQRKIDVATFTSASTVRNLMEMVNGHDVRSLMEGVVIACIGSITQQTVEEYGLAVQVMPKETTVTKLVEAVVDYFKREERS
jgi:uroporphyrinogen III methyltransferase/synthase